MFDKNGFYTIFFQRNDIIKKMPKVFELNGFKFFFYSNEGKTRERCHIHIRKETSVAKFWIESDIIIDSSYGFSAKELNLIDSKIKI